MRVFITGGSGFIGARLVRALVDGGHEPVCLSRSGKTSAKLAALGAEVLSGDLTEPESIKACVHEAKPTHVAHLAAEIATQRNRDRIEKVNIHGTQALVDACHGLPLERFLFLSTVVRGKASGETFTEADHIPATTPYGKSKAIGDELVLRAHGEWGLPGVILRPSHVYGPGGWFAGLLADRMFRIPGRGANMWDVVHVDDVVSAAMLLLEKGPAGHAFHVVDDEPVTMKTFFAGVAKALERKPYGHAPVWLAKMLKGSGAITAAVRSARSSNARLKELGWIPRFPRSTDAIPAVIRELAAAPAAGS